LKRIFKRVPLNWDPGIHTQNIDIMWMHVKRKLRRQFWMSRALFQTYLSEFRWMNFHRNDDKFNALMCCITDLYITWYNYIIFCPTDCVAILFHVFCQYTTFKMALIIYAAIIYYSRSYKVSNLRRLSTGLPKKELKTQAIYCTSRGLIRRNSWMCHLLLIKRKFEKSSH
jgi:hypothetical protein